MSFFGITGIAFNNAVPINFNTTSLIISGEPIGVTNTYIATNIKTLTNRGITVVDNTVSGNISSPETFLSTTIKTVNTYENSKKLTSTGIEFSDKNIIRATLTRIGGGGGAMSISSTGLQSITVRQLINEPTKVFQPALVLNGDLNTITGYTISGTIPANLYFNTSTGEITKTNSDPIPPTEITVVATTTEGTAITPFIIQTTNEVPVLGKLLSVSSATIGMDTPFTQIIDVLTEENDPATNEILLVPSTTVPVITADFIDSGVTITTSVGQVTISGQYKTIIQTIWEYINLSGTITTTDQVPALGTFEMITKVDSPAKLKEICTYTIDGEEFEHTVDLVSYTGIANTLKDLLATVA